MILISSLQQPFLSELIYLEYFLGISKLFWTYFGPFLGLSLTQNLNLPSALDSGAHADRYSDEQLTTIQHMLACLRDYWTGIVD